ncbi:MAG: 50S ribosomal protein L24 [Candidatus Micrarchaeia archaeon]|jgi:large subunit ribosomal protein L24
MNAVKRKKKAFHASKQPRKARKRFYSMPLHKKASLVRAHLSKELRKKLGCRSARLRKGDKVRVMRGSFKKKEGKVVEVDLKKAKVFIEGIVSKKQGGKEKLIPLQPSNLMIIETERKPKAAKEKK